MVASTTRVVPLPLGQIGAEGIPRQSEPEGIALSSLNPDTDGDGTIEEWEKDVYNRIVAADTDCTGTISRANLFDFIRGMSNEVKEAASKGIPISSLNPDTDGDGKVEKWEMDVFSRIKSADEDKSGSISVKELFGVIKGAAESDKQKKLFARLLVVAVLIIFALIGAMLAMGIVAGEAVKESHVTGQLMTTTAGDAVQVEPSRSYLSLFELPQASTASLAKMESLTMYIDMTTAAAISGWVEATYKVSGCYKKSDERLYLSTPEGHVITIDASQSRGTIAMADGANYDITDQTPPERRHMAVAKEPTFMSEREAREEHHRKLRELGFFTALMTSGNALLKHVHFCFAHVLYSSSLFRAFTTIIGRPASADRSFFVALMQRRQTIALLPGGFEEAALCCMATDRVYLRERKGWVKYALQHGYSLTPVFTFGELAPAADASSAIWGELVDEFHSHYIAALVALYDRHKIAYYGMEAADAMLEIW